MSDRTRTTFTAYITNRALTEGIQEKIVVDCFDISPDMVAVMGSRQQNFHKGQWHRTRAEAVLKAEMMRVAKLKSIDRQIAKLRALRFD